MQRKNKKVKSDPMHFSQEEKDYFLSIGYVVNDKVAYFIHKEDYIFADTAPVAPEGYYEKIFNEGITICK